MSKIAISIGHHQWNKGASWGNFNEYDEATIWANYIVDEIGEDACLVPAGYLNDKVDFINSIPDVRVALEVHFNSDPSHHGHGSETLYFPGSASGLAAANIVQSAIAQIFKPDRGVKEGWYRMNKDNGPDFFLRKTKCTALIIEPEFVHNIFTIKNNRKGGTAAIASALMELIHV